MGDFNDNNFPEQPDVSNDDNTLESQTSFNQNENESTYWETGGIGETNQTPVDNVNYDQNYQNSYQHTGTYNSLYEAPQKKRSKAPIVIALVAVLLIAFSATAFAFSDKAKNTLAMMTKSPAEYLLYVEKKSVEESMDKLTKYMKASGLGQDVAMELSSKLSYDKDTVSSLLAAANGMTIEDLETYLGISLDTIGFDLIVALEDKMIYEELGLNFNNIDIISAQLFMDSAAKEMLIRIPELSPAYLRQSLDMSEYGANDFDMENYNKAIDLIYSDRTTEFLKRYSQIITSEVKDVELTKGKDLTVGDITVKSNVLTLTLTNKTMTNIAKKVLEAAKDDEYLIDLFSLYSISKEEYQYELIYALEDLETYPDNDEEVLVMEVFVDGSGNVLGFDTTVKDSDELVAKFGYTSLEQNNKGQYKFHITDPASSNGLEVSGSHTINNGAYTGSASVEFIGSEFSGMSFNIKYNDVKSEFKNNRIYSYGKINISSFMMMGFEITIEHDVKDSAQLSNISLNMGSSPLVTLESSTKYLDNYKVPKPDSTSDVYDTITEIDAYSSSIDTDKFISDLSDKLGVDLENLFGNFIPYY